MKFNFLRGPSNGSVDSGRILFFFGGMSAIVSPVGFQIWAMIRHQPWDVTTYCLAYGGMLAAIILPGCAGIAIKDRGVAAANAASPPNAGSDT